MSDRTEQTRAAMPDSLVSREAEALFDNGDFDACSISPEDASFLLVELVERRQATPLQGTVGLEGLREARESYNVDPRELWGNELDDLQSALLTAVDEALASTSSENVGWPAGDRSRWRPIQANDSLEGDAFVLPDGEQGRVYGMAKEDFACREGMELAGARFFRELPSPPLPTVLEEEGGGR